MSHHKHHVKVHKWIHGSLQTFEHAFESLEEALGFAKNKHEEHVNATYDVPTDQHVKVYNDDGGLVHSTEGSADTYA